MKTILVVDDQTIVLTTLEAILKKEGYAVISCTNSIDAFEHVQREKFDLIVTDAVMPLGTSGFNLISSIRAHEGFNKNVPIIMLTGRREASDVEKAISVGANDYMIKPIDPDILTSKIKKLIQQSSGKSDFIQAPVDQPAAMATKIQIISTSEITLQFSSDLGFIPGKIYKISSDFFQIFEKDSVTVRIQSSQLMNGQYIIWANYVGLSDKEYSHIRTWIRQKLIPG